jgi:hypothetical protein
VLPFIPGVGFAVCVITGFGIVYYILPSDTSEPLEYVDGAPVPAPTPSAVPGKKEPNSKGDSETRVDPKTNGKQVTGKDCDKVDDKYLKKQGIDAYELKEGELSSNANKAQYDIYVNKVTKELYVFKKGGQGVGSPTGVYLK